jgi:hypothetical protein
VNKPGGLVTAVLLIGLLQSGCDREPRLQSTPLLAEARKDETALSPYVSPTLYKSAGKNLLERAVYETAGPPGVGIELRDLFVIPGTSEQNVSLPGAAILQVLSGAGKIAIAAKSETLALGTTLTVNPGESLALESRGSEPLILRAWIFTPQ